MTSPPHPPRSLPSRNAPGRCELAEGGHPTLTGTRPLMRHGIQPGIYCLKVAFAVSHKRSNPVDRRGAARGTNGGEEQGRAFLNNRQFCRDTPADIPFEDIRRG